MSGRLAILGLGPGDPELMTLKAARLLAGAAVVAHFAKQGRPGQARAIVEGRIPPGVEEIRFDYPFTTEVGLDEPRYRLDMGRFYDRCAETLAGRLGAGGDAVLLCEGDPFLYGSAMYLYDRLRTRFVVEVVPGVSGMSACWSAAGAPMVHGDDALLVLPATLPEAALAERLGSAEAAVVMKLGSNLAKVARALRSAGLIERALYVERGSMTGERVLPFAEIEREGRAPYFSLVLVPGRRGAR